MFHGGLNGDGFFDEEYSGYCQDGDSYGGGYIEPTGIAEYDVILTGKETEKAVQLKSQANTTFWMPKKAMTSPHYDYVEPWAVNMFLKNLLNSFRGVQK